MNLMIRICCWSALLFLFYGCTTTRPTVQAIQINECSSPSFMKEWNCIKSKVESIYNDNGTRTEKYISEYVFVGDKLVDSVKSGEINDQEASIRLLEFANDQDKQFQQKEPKFCFGIGIMRSFWRQLATETTSLVRPTSNLMVTSQIIFTYLRRHRANETSRQEYSNYRGDRKHR